MGTSHKNTLRLLFPQWQGGNNPAYHFGAKLLAWLTPEPCGPVEEVPVALPSTAPLQSEAGVVARTALVEQQRSARRLIDKHQPDRLVVLGGDCLVDLAPFAYLNELYDGDLAVLWVDSHPDISTADQLAHGHAMVLANLMGRGDEALAGEVKVPIKPENVLYVGVHDPSAWEAQEMTRLGLKCVGPDEVRTKGSQPVLDWFKSTGAKHLAVHLDLDVLSPTEFRAQLIANPKGIASYLENVARGELTMGQITTVLNDVATVADIVGVGIAEHLPWDAINLKNMIDALPLIGASAPAL